MGVLFEIVWTSYSSILYPILRFGCSVALLTILYLWVAFDPQPFAHVSFSVSGERLREAPIGRGRTVDFPTADSDHVVGGGAAAEETEARRRPVPKPILNPGAGAGFGSASVPISTSAGGASRNPSRRGAFLCSTPAGRDVPV
jgi:hypothetical protein